MKLCSRIKTAGDSGWIINEEECAFFYDVRLARRWKRRGIAFQHLGLNSCSHEASKKTINKNNKNNEALVKVVDIDSDYEKFLEEQFVGADSSDGMINEEESDLAYDLRLDKQWKRRCIASENHWLNSCSNKASKKTINKNNKNNEVLVKVVDADSHYDKCLEEQFVGADSSDGMINEKESDLAYDLRLDTQWKRRCIASENHWLNSCRNKASKKTIKKKKKNYEAPVEEVTVVSDCQKFLDDRLQFFDVDNDRWFGVNVDDDDDDVSEVLDAHYVIFLDNLKEDGKSYVLELNVSNKTTLVVKYEEENCLGNGLGMMNLATLEVSQNIENINTENILSSQLERENNEKPIKILRSNFGREKTGVTRKLLRNSMSQKTKRSKTVLRSRSGWRKTENRRKTLSSSKREENESPNILNDAVKREKTENLRTLRNGSRESMGTRKKLRDVWTIDKKSSVFEKDVQMATEIPVSCPAKGCSRKRHSLEVTHLEKKRINFKHGMKSDSVDESYQIFMNSVKKDEQYLVNAPDGGNKVVYFRDEESDSDLIVLDDPFFMGNHTPFVSSKYGPCVDVDAEGCTEIKESPFREKLLEVLQKPYDIREYGRLQSDSKSYLPHFKDLATKIHQARRDRRKILNLLRGFFYWVQYLNAEGAFPPWLDSQCLSISPPD